MLPCHTKSRNFTDVFMVRGGGGGGGGEGHELDSTLQTSAKFHHCAELKLG